MFCNSCGAALPDAAAKFCPSCGRQLDGAPVVVVKKGLSPLWIVVIALGVCGVPTLGILAAIAIPAYQDYTTRTYVSEGLNAAAPLKLAVSEYALEHDGEFPSSPDDVAAAATTHPRLQSMALADEGVITLVYAAPASVAGKSVVLTPMARDGDVQWSCNGVGGYGESGTMDSRYLPSSCRAGR